MLEFDSDIIAGRRPEFLQEVHTYVYLNIKIKSK